MIPDSLKQVRFRKIENVYKLFIWSILRYIQLNNTRVYSEIYLSSEYPLEKLNIPKECIIKKEPSKKTLIIAPVFNLKILLRYFFMVKNLRILDQDFFLTSAASTNFRLYFYDFISDNERKEYKDLSLKNIKKLKDSCEKLKQKQLLLLGTGPSFLKGKNYAIQNNIKTITCNSAIYDQDIWKKINPILCFADPVFHFGNSVEAKRFKNEVISKFNESKFFIICPINAMPILIKDWGIEKNYVIGLNFEKISGHTNPLLGQKLSVKRTSNVLTEFMLPIASHLSKNILLAGFDGRKINDKNFWQYSKNTHQPLNEHKAEHPSFFNDRNIERYYQKHLKTFESQLIKLENVDYEIFNLTNSNIKFLNRRNIDE